MAPSSPHATGYGTQREAREAALADLIKTLPKAFASEAQSIHDELRNLKAQVEQRIVQPSLF